MSNFPQGYFFIRNVASGLVLDVARSSTEVGSRDFLIDRIFAQRVCDYSPALG